MIDYENINILSEAVALVRGIFIGLCPLKRRQENETFSAKL